MEKAPHLFVTDVSYFGVLAEIHYLLEYIKNSYPLLRRPEPPPPPQQKVHVGETKKRTLIRGTRMLPLTLRIKFHSNRYSRHKNEFNSAKGSLE